MIRTSAEIRQAFLSYFAEQGHTVVSSSSLVPANDPTLLFTNAGMVQFKDVFLGQEKRDYVRAVSSQRCVRAGGKHNDLENVGFTARHHTFFEMLGNFSFGDYFKREAIGFAWDFLTRVLKLPETRLWVTVHVSDDEAADIWLNEIGVSSERFSRLDEDNFWQMGDTGPCGPCSEIFYDHGEDVPGGPPGSENDDLDRYIEIWNLVFMQYERSAGGDLNPLPRPSIDTGMGLERIAAVMQGVHSNYEIDLFANLIAALSEITGGDSGDNSLRVIADHIRSSAFLIVDGVVPSNEGQGYVLRRIIRRALRHGHKLGVVEPFFYLAVAPLVREMGEAYPELAEKQAQVESTLRREEEKFAETLDRGMAVLESSLRDIPGETLPGDLVFLLYDTYGFPVDLTNDIARERGYSLDTDGYEQCMAQQRARARAAGQFDMQTMPALEIDGATDFTGYQSLDADSRVIGLYRDAVAVESVEAGDEAIVVLEKTPFYAESGGQVGDRGEIVAVRNPETLFEVRDCRKQGDNHLHLGRVRHGTLKVGDEVKAKVDGQQRWATALNHSATHLLHAALRQVLGAHVTQKGSLVDARRLRFDFSHDQALTGSELSAVEDLVNQQIRQNSKVQVEELTLEAAKEKGAMALFGEKYGDNVRVLTMGGHFSVELCGGTHVVRTGDIGVLKIVSESGIAGGVRRIEAVTGTAALEAYREIERELSQTAGELKVKREDVFKKAQELMVERRELQKELERLKARVAGGAGGDIMEGMVSVNDVSVLARVVEDADARMLRQLTDQAKSRLDKGVVLLASATNGKVALVAGVTNNLTEQVRAGDLVQFVASRVGGKGGGRADMAQGGGTDINALPAAVRSVEVWVREQVDA